MLTGSPYPLRALFCAGGNPLNIQDARRVWDGLKSLDLLVVADFFMTPVAELADYVLPVTTWLERDDCCDFKYMDCIAARQRAVDPPPECRDDLQIVIDLVKRIPWADRRFLRWDDVAEFNDFRVSGIGVTFEDFKEMGYLVGTPAIPEVRGGGVRHPVGQGRAPLEPLRSVRLRPAAHLRRTSAKPGEHARASRGSIRSS